MSSSLAHIIIIFRKRSKKEEREKKNVKGREEETGKGSTCTWERSEWEKKCRSGAGGVGCGGGDALCYVCAHTHTYVLF